VEIGYDGGHNATTPELFSSNWTVNPAPVVTNSAAYGTLAEMFTAATTGMTTANGWNSFWTVDAENNTLKFGQTVVYQPQAE
jgi:hypothetical protein